ncbi:MAG: hypothetical protein RIF36_13105 [Imperialibacter sp.]|uniref:hypothetical protein n=1 Tax=Imperialibacter sp. TaxID=2038411 RepID=UPI0032EC6999
MNRYWQIYLLIFRAFVVYTLIFSSLALVIYVNIGWLGLIYIFWIKVVGFLAICALYYFSKDHQLTFFHNLGLSVPALLAIAGLSDIILFLGAVAITNSIT